MDPNKLLGIYMNDHLAGSALGTALARRIERSQGKGEARDETAEVARQIQEDREALLAMMRRLGIRPSHVKQVAASVAEKLGRLKLNGAVLRRSPLSRLVEIEAMALGVTGKQQLWRSLEQLASGDPRIHREELARLIERAGRQLEALEELRLESVRHALIEGTATHSDRPTVGRGSSG